MRLQTRIALSIVAVVLISATVTIALGTYMFLKNTNQALEQNLLEVAETVAHLPIVVSDLRGPPVIGDMHHQVNNVLDTFADVDLIVVCNMKSERYAHPNPAVIGLTFKGGDDVEVVQSAKRYVSTAEGTLGVSTRAFVPVFDGDEQLGFVVAGAMTDRVDNLRWQMIRSAGIYLVSGLVVGIAGAVLLARKLKGILLGMEPEELAQLYRDHIGMLGAVHEGAIAIDANGLISMFNESALQLLDRRGQELKGLRLEAIMPDSGLPAVMATGKAEYDREQRIGGRVVITNRVPILENGRVAGAVETFRDRTPLIKLVEELTGARQLVEALRASSHEFLNKLQVLLGLLDLEQYDRAKQYILDVQHHQNEQNKELLHTFRDPVIAGLMLGKMSYCREQNVQLVITPESRIDSIEDAATIHALVTTIGNLVDNAVESARNVGEGRGRVVVDMRQTGDELFIEVRDNGAGIAPDRLDAVFDRGYTTRGEGRGTGLYLVRQDLRDLGGDVAVASAPGDTVFTARLRIGGHA